jgi:hypothetical protein
MVTRGLHVELGPYGLRVLDGFAVVEATTARPYDQLAASLGDHGVASVEAAVRRPLVAAAHGALRRLLEPAVLLRLLEAPEGERETLLDGAEGAALRAFRGTPPTRALRQRLAALLALLADGGAPPPPLPPLPPPDRSAFRLGLLAWAFLRSLGPTPEAARERYEASLLGEAVADALAEAGASTEEAHRLGEGLRFFLSDPPGEPSDNGGTAPWLETCLADDALRRLLGIHRFDGIVWFREEGYQEFLWWLWATAAVNGNSIPAARLRALATAVEPSGYRLDALLEALGEDSTEALP